MMNLLGKVAVFLNFSFSVMYLFKIDDSKKGCIHGIINFEVIHDRKGTIKKLSNLAKQIHHHQQENRVALFYSEHPWSANQEEYCLVNLAFCPLCLWNKELWQTKSIIYSIKWNIQHSSSFGRCIQEYGICDVIPKAISINSVGFCSHVGYIVEFGSFRLTANGMSLAITDGGALHF